MVDRQGQENRSEKTHDLLILIPLRPLRPCGPLLFFFIMRPNSVTAEPRYDLLGLRVAVSPW